MSIKLINKQVCQKETTNTYDIEVGSNHNYFANGVLVHNCKDPDTAQAKALFQIQPKYKIGMTGTPLMNSPLDLYSSLYWLGYEDHKYYQFKYHYCDIEKKYTRPTKSNPKGEYSVIVGYKNLAQLRAVTDAIMLRRLKSEVLNLPPKTYTEELIEMDSKQSNIYNAVEKELLQDLDLVKSSHNPLAKLVRLRQATGNPNILTTDNIKNAKLERLKDIVEEVVAENGKVIVFSNWTKIINPAYQELFKYNPALITGEVKDTLSEVFKFMNDDSCKVILGTTSKMGTGYTLTAGTTVVFLDSPWNKANKEQACDRTHRIGTKGTINIITLVCVGTIDEKIEKLVEQKGAMADLLIDGKILGGKQAELIDYLLAK